MDEMELDYGAITIDNNILKGAGYKFYEGLLKQMIQFSDSPVRVVQTDIVHQEAKKHMAAEISNSRSAIKKALRLAKNHLNIDVENVNSASALLFLASDDDEISEQRLKEYYEKIGAEFLVTGQYIDPIRLMEMYFATEAPFELKEEKKYEFPDAIALLSLENWAEENNLQVIAVSADKGWKNFANKSTRITVLDDLAAAISKFQPHNQVKGIIEKIRKSALLDEENHVLTEIEEAIADSLDGADIYVEASSAYYYDASDVIATYVDHKLVVDDQGVVEINIVSIKDDVVVLQVCAEVTCEVSVDFSFSNRDPIDKDYVRIGSAAYSTEESYNTDILISLTGDFTDDFKNLDIFEIEVLETIDHVEFEEVEPDYGYEEDD